MADPKRDDTAEKEVSSEENKQETEQLLTPNRKEVLAQLLAPNNLIGLLTLYMLLLGAVVAFGVFAFYTGHKITQDILFFVSVILFLILPIGALCYLLQMFIKKDVLLKLLDIINQSSISKSLARLGNNRIFRLFSLALNVFMIADAIYSSPKHPRFSLVIVVIYLALSFWLVISWASEVLASSIYQTIGKILDLIENTYRMADAARGIAESAHKYIEATEPSHDQAHRTMVAALDALLNTMGVMADAIHGPNPPQLAPPAQEEPHSEDDEEPSDG